MRRMDTSNAAVRICRHAFAYVALCISEWQLLLDGMADRLDELVAALNGIVRGGDVGIHNRIDGDGGVYRMGGAAGEAGGFAVPLLESKYARHTVMHVPYGRDDIVVSPMRGAVICISSMWCLI